MSIRLQSNIPALQAQRRLSDVTSGLRKTYERLSSGLRINRASDDAAGLSIAESLKADSRVKSQGIRNANDALSALTIAEGAMDTLSTILERMEELGYQAANGTNTTNQRRAINAEAQALQEEYNRIIQTTEFNGRRLLFVDGETERVDIQLGYGTDYIGIELASSLSATVGDGTFRTPVSVAAGSGQGGSVVTGDLNGDGLTDILSTDYGGLQTDILLANGDGTFRLSHYTSVTQYQYAAELRDINNDGSLDLLTTVAAIGSFFVALGNGNGTFRAGVTYAGPSGVTQARQITSGDFNGDGIADVVYGTGNTESVVVALGNGNGSFRAGVSFSAAGNGTSLKDVEVGDLNGDGFDDIITGTTSGGGSVGVLLGTGTGSFQSVQTYSATTLGGIGVSDINSDGILDVVGTGFGTNTIQVLLGNSNGSFQAATTFQSSATPLSLLLEDMNGDGLKDAVYFSQSGSMSINLGNGDGTFRATNSTAITSSPNVLATNPFAIGQFVRDGPKSVAIVGQTANVIELLFANEKQYSLLPEVNFIDARAREESLEIISDAQLRLGAERGMVGAFQSRLQSSVSNLLQQRENFDAAASQILDADVAVESSALVRQQILQRAAQAVLAQANILPELGLRLLNVR